jgi:hypothetical protein
VAVLPRRDDIIDSDLLSGDQLIFHDSFALMHGYLKGGRSWLP